VTDDVDWLATIRASPTSGLVVWLVRAIRFVDEMDARKQKNAKYHETQRKLPAVRAELDRRLPISPLTEDDFDFRNEGT
jgi:hypothetical protein